MKAREVNFDGLVGLTHHYAGLSFGNEASTKHRFQISNPQLAAKQGLLKMKALADAGLLPYGSNVKQVTTQVSEGAVDCGIIYATDAFSAGLDTVDEATADMCGQVIYPAAVLKNSTHADEAKAFLDYLTTDEAGKVFESVGFTTLA